jgi:hypothetical protein
MQGNLSELIEPLTMHFQSESLAAQEA